MGEGATPASRADREGALRANVSRLSDDADDPQVVASALSAIRKELRGSPEGPEWVVKVRDTALLTAAAADAISRDDIPRGPPPAPPRSNLPDPDLDGPSSLVVSFLFDSRRRTSRCPPGSQTSWRCGTRTI